MGLAGGQWGVTKDSHAHYFTFSLANQRAKMGLTLSQTPIFQFKSLTIALGEYAFKPVHF